MGILDLLNGIGQPGAAPWMERLMTSGAGQGMGGLGQGGLQDFLKQLMPPQGGGQGGGQQMQAPSPQQAPPSQSADLTAQIMQYLQQRRR